MGSAKGLIYLLLLAALIGAAVLLLDPHYRRDHNLVSNRNFYSALAKN
ncbi:MAG: hypothetical protein P9M08_01440 [Candidatus Erginobacter occultus]|nr:hypothetical protein [Candidatus Erginobacter occultus]